MQREAAFLEQVFEIRDLIERLELEAEARDAAREQAKEHAAEDSVAQAATETPEGA
jgi:hypothetical protein